MSEKFQPASFRSLTVKLSAAFLLLSLSILLVTSILEVTFSFLTQRQLIANQYQLVAEDAADTVRSFVMVKFRALIQAADVNSLATSNERRELVLNKLLGGDPSFRQLYLLDKEGNMVHKTSRLSLLDSNAVLEHDDQVLEAALSGKNYTSPIYIDQRTNEPVFLISVPTRDIFDEPQGAFIAEVNLKFMWDLVGGIQVGRGGQAYVVDKAGDLIAARDISRVLRRENLSPIREVEEFQSGGDDEAAEISTGFLGTKVVAVFVPLGTPDWAVVVEVPVLEAYGSVLYILAYAIGIIVLASVFALISGAYVARKLTRPLVELNAAAEAISSGNMNVSIHSISNDEIGNLAQAFNSMTERLRGLYGSLETSVREKTIELSAQLEQGEKSKLAILNLLEDIEQEKKKVDEVVVERTRELANEKARLISSINSLSFGFVIADVNDQILLMNPAMAVIIGMAMPTSVRDIVKVVGRDDLLKACHECMLTQKPVEIKDIPFGTLFLRAMCVPILGEGKTIGYVFMLEDVSKAKIMERSRDEFFAVASHELRTPLTAIRGNTEMILDMFSEKIKDADMTEMLMDINSASIRLIELVNDFLEVSRLEQGRIEIHNELFDIREVIDRVVRDMRRTVEKKGIKLLFEPPEPALPLIMSDKFRIEQVVLNLIGNAAKFTKQGSITIKAVHEGASLHVSVSDTGIGISQENQALLFRKFQQAGEKMLARDVTQGTGMGLYICKLLLALMGGTIALEKSEFGTGSTFGFTVPIKT